MGMAYAGSAEHPFGMKQCHDAELVLGAPGQGLKARQALAWGEAPRLEFNKNLSPVRA